MSEIEKKEKLNLLNKHKSEGYSILPGDNNFNVVSQGDCCVGRVTIYPGTIQYDDLINDRIYFADINNNLSSGERTNLPEIPPDICVDISSVAAELIPKRESFYDKYPNIKQIILPDNHTQTQSELVDKLLPVTTFSGLLNQFFPNRDDLSLVDIGSGYGEFPLELSKMMKDLGINSIKATDIHLELMLPKLKELIKAGVTVRFLNATNSNVPKNYCDIVTLNAPQVFGENAYAGGAVSNAIKMLKNPGLLLLRLNEDSSDLLADKYDLSLVDKVGVRVRELKGLPDSKFAIKNSLYGDTGPSSVFIIAKM